MTVRLLNPLRTAVKVPPSPCVLLECSFSRREERPARRARTIAVKFCAGHPLSEQVVNAAAQVVFELVANAVEHAAAANPVARIGLLLAMGASQLVVDVRDEDPRPPVFPAPGTPDVQALLADDDLDADDPALTRGRGLALVAGLAESVTVRPAPGGGKTVRATIATAP